MYFKHSGRFTVGGLAVGIATGSAASALLAYASARGLILITDEHVAMFATFAFGALIGAASGYGLVWGKIRNQPVAVAVLGTISVLALYLSWAMWVQSILETQHLQASWVELARDPAALWATIRLINQYGTWSTDAGGAPTTGWELWGIWFAEAAAVIGIAMSIGYAIWNHRPFCEACDCWCGRGASITLAPPQNVAQLKRDLEANDLRSLGSLGPGSSSTTHLVVALDSCERCRAFHTMSLTEVTIRKGRLGRTGITKKKIVHHLLLKPGQAEQLRHLSEETTQSVQLNIPKANAATAAKR